MSVRVSVRTSAALGGTFTCGKLGKVEVGVGIWNLEFLKSKLDGCLVWCDFTLLIHYSCTVWIGKENYYFFGIY